MPENHAESPRGGAVLTAATLTVLAVSMAKTSADSNGQADSIHSHDRSDRPRVPATTKKGFLGKIDLFQQRHRPTAFVVGVIKKFGDDRAGRLAALVAYYGFFSIFPAMLALITVLGFVLEGRDDLREDIANSALAQFPVIGDSISSQVSEPLSGNTIALIIGVLGAVWAGLGAMQAAQDGLNEVWDVPRTENPNFFKKRLRSVAMLMIIVVDLVVSSTISQLAVNVVSGALATIGLFLASIVINVIMFSIAFRVLTVAPMTWRRVFPGAVLAGVVYSILQAIGAAYIEHTLKGAEDTYGTFAIVIGLLSWIFLIAQLTMMSAEVNVVLARGEWPRSLFNDTVTPADESIATAQAKESAIAVDEHVAVSFEEPSPDSVKTDERELRR